MDARSTRAPYGATLRIVIVSPTLPLPFAGADGRWLHVLTTELARRGVDVVCVSSTEEQPARIEAARRHASSAGVTFEHVPLRLEEPLWARKVASIRRPFSELSRSVSLRGTLDRVLAGGYDVLHIDHLYSAWLGLDRDRAVTYVYNFDVVDWELRQGLTLRERRVLVQMRRATRSLVRRTARLIVMTPRLATEAARWRSAGVEVVPMGIDASLYALMPRAAGRVVGLIGSMHHWPSRSAAERLLDLWPRIHAQVPDADLRIGGWNAGRYLGHRFPLEGARLLERIDRPSSFFGQISALVYPTPRGSGMKVKVLEAMAYGVPVVTSRDGAEGIDGESAAGIVLASSDEEFVARTVAILRDDQRRQALGSAGRRYVEERCSPAVSVDRLLDAYGRFGLI